VKRLGFIGTGSLAAFFVEGLKRAGADYEIMVSPRNREKAESLRQRFAVAIAGNQEIADRCDLVVVSVLPRQASDALAPLRFRQGQTVLSVMSGIGLAAIRHLAAPADAAISMMPGLANAHDCGPSVLHPDNAAARSLLSHLGPVHAYDREETFMAASVMGAFSGMTNLVMRDAIDWFAGHGLAPEDARRLVAGVLKGNAEALLASPLSIEEVARGVVTPGGITELGRKVLDSGGNWAQALDAVLRRVTTRG
jgi:pyrroline-5-carboxylate reductase